MDEQRIRKYFVMGYAIKIFQLAVFGVCMSVGVIYFFLQVPMFMLSDYFQVTALTALIVVSFLLSTFITTPSEYRLDKNYGRTTFGFRSYFAYKMRSKLTFLIPFALLLLLYASFWLFTPVDSTFTTLLMFGTIAIMILLIGLVMPRIFGSALKKEKIQDQSLLDAIKDLAERMGIRGKFTGAFHVPVRGFKVVNAAQLGFARRQARVFLIGDIDSVLNRKEIEAVVAHEFAHLKLRHILKLTLLLLGLMIVVYSAFTIVATVLLYFLLANGVFLTDELVFSIVIALEYLIPFAVLFLVLMKLRRLFETEADVFAARVTNPMDLATSLEKLADYNLVPMRFPMIIGILKGHPSMRERIERLKRMA